MKHKEHWKEIRSLILDINTKINRLAKITIHDPSDDSMDVLNTYCKALHVTPADILQQKRSRPLHDKRICIIYLLYKYNGYTISQIGRLIERHHTSILSALRQHDSLYSYEEDYRLLVDKVILKLDLK